LEAGQNYGWPEVEGVGGVDGFTDPLAVWAPQDASPSGLAVTKDGVFLAGLRGRVLWRLPVRPLELLPGITQVVDSPVGTPQELLRGEHGRLRAVQEAPDG